MNKIELTNKEHFQAAVKIQRAWRESLKCQPICPYCSTCGCDGAYSQFKCKEMWDSNDLQKLDSYIDRLHGRW